MASKINVKRLCAKAAEDGIKKAIELTILAVVLGSTANVILVAVPAVAVGAAVAKCVKICILNR